MVGQERWDGKMIEIFILWLGVVCLCVMMFLLFLIVVNDGARK